MKRPLVLLLAAASSAVSAIAQDPPATPRAEDRLHRQTEPVASAVTLPVFKGQPAPVAAAVDNASEAAPAGPAEEKAKGPTQIDSLEATFDQKANVAVFIGDVVVTDPEFNVKCDKLTAFLKSAEKTKPADPAAKTPKPATPAPPGAKKQRSSGLKNAIADADQGKRVIITQDKLQADGTVQHSIGKGDRATYDAVTGDIVLYGTPDVQQGVNLVVATSPSTVMTLNRDGHMHSKGSTRTTIVDTGSTGH